MKKYEYTKYMLGRDMASNFYVDKDDTTAINELGKQGWDLVHVVGSYLIFKRELLEKAPEPVFMGKKLSEMNAEEIKEFNDWSYLNNFPK